MSFASKLQEIRQKNGLSQEQFAEILNVSRQSVSKWERGKGYPEIEKLVFISSQFNVSLDELLKENVPDAEYFRQPINLEKDVCRNTEEIYPGEQPGGFAAQEVRQQADIAQYSNNYIYAQQSSAYGNGGGFSGAGNIKRKRNSHLLKIALIMAFIVVTVSIVGVLSSFVYLNQAAYEDDIWVDSVYDNIKCYTDESTGTFYLIDADTNLGLADFLTSDEFDTYIKLHDPETGKDVYCFQWYFNESLCVNINDRYFIMPDYFTDTLINSYEYEQYYVGNDTSGTVRFVRKDYIPFELSIKTDNDKIKNDDIS